MPRRLAMIREIEVSTTIQPYEDLDLVVNSVRSFFPDWDPDLPLRDDGFPSNNSHEIIHLQKNQMIQMIIDNTMICLGSGQHQAARSARELRARWTQQIN